MGRYEHVMKNVIGNEHLLKKVCGYEHILKNLIIIIIIIIIIINLFSKVDNSCRSCKIAALYKEKT